MIGKNLNYEDSFRLKIINGTTSNFNLNLFNLGGGSSTQTSISTSVASYLNNDVTSIISATGVFTAGGNFQVVDTNAVTIVNVNMSPFQTIQDLMNAVNPITDSFGNVGYMYVQVSPTPIVNPKEFDWFFTLGTIASYTIDEIPPNPPAPETSIPLYQTLTYVSNNPFIQVLSQTNLNYIQNSEIGNAYKIMGVDVYSTSQSQLLNSLGYTNRDVNGNLVSFATNPTVDPYQPNRRSLHMIDVEDFIISTNTQFQYTINSLTTAFLNFNYLRSGVSDFKEFDMAYSLQKREKYVTNKLMLDKNLDKEGILLQ